MFLVLFQLFLVSTSTLANLVVTDGDYFDPKSRIISLWLSGEEHYIAPRHFLSAKGTWALDFHKKEYVLEFSLPKPKKGSAGGKAKWGPVESLAELSLLKMKKLNLEISISMNLPYRLHLMVNLLDSKVRWHLMVIYIPIICQVLLTMVLDKNSLFLQVEQEKKSQNRERLPS
jgi:hypothetical protein